VEFVVEVGWYVADVVRGEEEETASRSRFGAMVKSIARRDGQRRVSR
jgi:hypothetical protein